MTKTKHNTEWMSDFAFATDIMQKMNELHDELQEKGVEYLLMIYIWRLNHFKQSLHVLQNKCLTKTLRTCLS